MNYLLNFLAVIVFFINRYFFRKKKTDFDWHFWIQDNWPELSMTLLLNLIFMIMLHLPEADAGLAKLPEWIMLFGKPGISIALGLGLSWGAYELFKRKV
ncbi:MAG: hypothetical protein ACM3RX_03000, partial [Methanococcaceae archaeon]